MIKLLLATALLVLAVAAIGPRLTARVHGCAFSRTPNAYEGPKNRGPYLVAEEMAGFNMFAPNDTYFGTPNIDTGPRANRTRAAQPYIPPALLKATGYIESALAQAATSVPWSAVGPALISFDCGHGIMQVTSGMTSPADSGWPSTQQALIATHYLYNIGHGAAILADKWNAAPEARPIVGNGDPAIVEDWYYAVWSYNGFANVNNPLNAAYNWPRTGFSCSPHPDDGFGHTYAGYPYQEIIFGCAARPPAAEGEQLWPPQHVSLPDLNDAAYRDPLSRFPNTSQMDMPDPATTHTDDTARPAANAASFLMGSPALSVSRSQVSEQSNSVTISNTGTGILSWRARPGQSWIHVDKQAGVALAADVPCGAGSPCQRSPALIITVDGDHTGWVDIVSLQTGQTQRVAVLSNAYDVNCDGATNTIDAALVLQVSASLIGPLPCPGNADANGDGRINPVDAFAILQLAAGLT